jgi:hypothetical protein
MMELNVAIPGENYTADTRNYPWHRPADFDNYDDVVDHLITQMENASGISMIYSLLDLEVPISGIVTVLLLQSISKGRIHIDMAILAAGPLARHIEIFAKKNDIKYDMGDKPSDEIVYTPTEIKLAMGISDDAEDVVEESIVVPKEPSEGLMAKPTLEQIKPAAEDEQLAMLGLDNEEEESV